ncbi:universal stress protein [Aurantimonas sp. C2-6-R+9]|uniref:universal stress protein n=1 Tax=unclassified Aurantimonas TaxID=2638230 RepID=UPI002E189D5A|nr:MULTISPECIES: universal stress protein [unclassified Aurantimonas]MEC5292935.1 universal stress protein [Aurantimonas sp. C2-3-R2]MEC5383137.1 universal stress protein [Aurantimonas sp. C2-6-R+9]MEC5413969.1 universal stress protein [Aurantimonas sp. C2-4-R8]
MTPINAKLARTPLMLECGPEVSLAARHTVSLCGEGRNAPDRRPSDSNAIVIAAQEPCMSYASIMMHVDNDDASTAARLDLAGALATRFDAVLIGVAAAAIRPPPVDAFGGVVFVDVIAEERERIAAEVRAAEARFRSHFSGQAITTEWRSAIDMPAETLAREARSADLIIVGRDLDQHHASVYQTVDPGEVVMAAGRPVLIVPPGTRALSAEHVVIAWKDTREARRALWDASPFLRAAASVHLVEIAPKAELGAAQARTADVVRHLERHRVKARAEVRAQREASVADELILIAEQNGADLIVGGGYGHARLREWVFGGVTHDLLRRCPICCLLSH